jgi:hypothetical protein
MKYIILLTFWHTDVLISLLQTLLEVKNLNCNFLLYFTGGNNGTDVGGAVKHTYFLTIILFLLSESGFVRYRQNT